ncbi:VWA domain-containing protein [Xylanivirga thermophila]|uniref:VWA domain-containing protein n=1 Tax=Xylanivirga thermophila TaxID=2496273 RepID=UPI00101BA7A8|nr:VWA domain-containing protein [Xylanivirga thermophila]
MGISFSNPWWLLALIPVLGFVIWTAIYMGGIRGKKAKVGLGLRIASLTIVVLALCGMGIDTLNDKTSLVFVADISNSTKNVKGQIDEFISTAISKRSDKFEVGIVSFGKDAMVEHPVSSDVIFSGLETTPNPNFTNIDDAIKKAVSIMPADGRKKIVLLTDGSQNVGDGIERANMLYKQGIRLDGVFLDNAIHKDAQISDIELPSHVYEGEDYTIRIRVDSSIVTTAILRIYMDRELIGKEDVTLQKGQNIFVFNKKADEGGIKAIEASLEVEDDDILQNNTLSSHINISGRPNIAVVEGMDGASREVSKVLQSGGIDFNLYTPNTLPSDMGELGKYHAMILCNVSADDLDESRLSMIKSYVEQLGRGLLVVGGDNSYALGGYQDTPLGDILPVDSSIEQKGEIPSLALALVIDKSSSMAAGEYGVSRLDLAKEAAIRSLGVLREQDKIGIVAFDSAPFWVVNMQKPEDIESIEDAIGIIKSGGGTNMYPALKMAVDALKEENAKLKHIIALTDGQSMPGDFEGIIDETQDLGITLSTVAVGQDADKAFLEKLSEGGNGRYYYTDEFSNLPKIFAKETFMAAQTYIQNDKFHPIISGDSPIMTGLNSGVPALYGYIATTIKPGASMVLSSPKEHPILAEWQYGMGRVVAWTSDFTGTWSGDWISWGDVSKFWMNTISSILPVKQGGTGDINVERTGDKGEIVFKTQDDMTGDVAHKAVVIYPEGSKKEIDLDAEKPGEFKGRFYIEDPGVYAIKIIGYKNGKVQNSLDTALSVSYSPEYDMRNAPSREFVERLVQSTGGRMLTSPDEVFVDDMKPVWSHIDISRYLLIIALLLFAADIGIRRLV